MEFPDFSLTDKVALLTGGDKGIGQGIAVAMGHAGASVAFTTRHLPRAGETVRMLEELGRPAMAVELDVTKVEMIQPVVEQVMERFGRIDVLVNNAGLNVPQDPFEVTEEVWDTVYETNVKGLFFVSQAIGKVMSKQGEHDDQDQWRESFSTINPLLAQRDNYTNHRQQQEHIVRRCIRPSSGLNRAPRVTCCPQQQTAHLPTCSQTSDIIIVFQQE